VVFSLASAFKIKSGLDLRHIYPGPQEEMDHPSDSAGGGTRQPSQQHLWAVTTCVEHDIVAISGAQIMLFGGWNVVGWLQRLQRSSAAGLLVQIVRNDRQCGATRCL